MRNMNEAIEHQVESNERKHLSFLEKATSIAVGPVIGMLPPQVQRRIASEESAALMSKASRYVNSAAGVCGLASLACNAFGLDIDSTPGNFATWTGVALAADSFIREVFNGLAYVYHHPDTDHLKVWGEPVISILYSKFDKEEQ